MGLGQWPELETSEVREANRFQNNYQQDDTYGLSFISGSGTEHVGERVEYSKRLHNMPEAACTVKK